MNRKTNQSKTVIETLAERLRVSEIRPSASTRRLKLHPSWCYGRMTCAIGPALGPITWATLQGTWFDHF